MDYCLQKAFCNFADILDNSQQIRNAFIKKKKHFHFKKNISEISY